MHMLLEEESAGKPGNNQLQQPNGSVPGQQIIPDSKSQKGNHHFNIVIMYNNKVKLVTG